MGGDTTKACASTSIIGHFKTVSNHTVQPTALTTDYRLKDRSCHIFKTTPYVKGVFTHS